jgi:ABC transport system ATP-binding/permease protein
VAKNQPPIVNVRELVYRVAGRTILNQVDAIIHEGECVCVVGRNGSGKSTLLRLLAGDEGPTDGTIMLRGGARCAYLAQVADVDPARTVRENILDGVRPVLELIGRFERLPPHSPEAAALEARIAALDGWTIDTRLNELVTSLSAPSLSLPAANLSGGELRRVALCRTLIGQPDMVLLDEPTNHLDTEAISWLETYISRGRGTFVCVTHDRAFLDAISDRVLELSHGGLYSFEGGYVEYLRGKADREATAEQQELRRQRFIRREIDWIRRGPKARGTKSRSRIQRFDDAVSRSDLARDADVEIVIPPPPPSGQQVVSFDRVCKSYGGPPLLDQFSYELTPGTRLGIIGRNGLGKTTLLRLLLGGETPDSGVVDVAERTVFNYMDQHRELLTGTNTVFDEVGEGRDHVQVGERRLNLWSYLKRFLFTDDEINTRIDQLSGGEQSRVLLAKLLRRGGNVLVLDEPTNDLDLSTLRVLEEALASFAGCVIVVSHDRFFLNRVCTGILAFEGEGRLVYQEGDYDYYADKRAERPASAAFPAAGAPKAVERPRTSSRRLKWREERELEGMEGTILAAEETVGGLEELFSQPDFFEKHGRDAARLTAELEGARSDVARLYERWAELEDMQNGDG